LATASNSLGSLEPSLASGAEADVSARQAFDATLLGASSRRAFFFFFFFDFPVNAPGELLECCPLTCFSVAFAWLLLLCVCL
jgi:hypothetical protein